MSDIETQLQQRAATQVVSSLRVEVVDGPDRGLHATAATRSRSGPRATTAS
jgi:hypothetical protein